MVIINMVRQLCHKCKKDMGVWVQEEPYIPITCDSCLGTGAYDSGEPCIDCEGTGEVKEIEDGSTV